MSDPAPPLDEAPVPDEPDWDDSEPAEAPPVQNLAEATWALRRLRRAKKLLAEHEAEYAQMVAELDEWHATIGGDLGKKVAADERLLGNYLRARIDVDPKGPKSLSLPGGRITSQAGSLVVEVDDEAAFMAWAREHHAGLVNTPPPKPPPPETPDKAAIKQAATSKDESQRFLAPVGDVEKPGTYEIVDPATGGPDLETGEIVPPAVVPGVRLVRKDRQFDVEVEGT